MKLNSVRKYNTAVRRKKLQLNRLSEKNNTVFSSSSFHKKAIFFRE